MVALGILFTLKNNSFHNKSRNIGFLLVVRGKVCYTFLMWVGRGLTYINFEEEMDLEEI